jgi:hypothetical protein
VIPFGLWQISHLVPKLFVSEQSSLKISLINHPDKWKFFRAFPRFFFFNQVLLWRGISRQFRWEKVPVRPIWPNYKQLRGLEDVVLRLAYIFNIFPIDEVWYPKSAVECQQTEAKSVTRKTQKNNKSKYVKDWQINTC